MSEKAVAVGRWVVWPAMLTVVIAIIRLAGELNEWNPLLFSRAEGGGMALIGIVWLVPIFGVYFAWKLGSAGHTGRAGRTIGFALLGLAVMVVGGVLTQLTLSNQAVAILVFGIAAIIAIVVTRFGWPELFALLLTYGFAVRIPMVGIYFLAFSLGWKTHYSAVPPDFPLTGWFGQWLVLGVLPQLTFWVAFTVVFGALFGGLTLLIRRSGYKAATGQ